MNTPEKVIIRNLLNKHISKLEKKKNVYNEAIIKLEKPSSKLSKKTKTLYVKAKEALKKAAKNTTNNREQTYL